MEENNSKEKILILALFFIAFINRIYGIKFGLPAVARPDEQVLIREALNLGSGNFKLGYFFYSSIFLTILFLLFCSYYLIGRAFSIFANLEAFAISYLTDPSIFHLIPRIFSVVLGSLTVIIIYFAAKELYSKNVAKISALFLSFCYLHCRDSHFGTVHITLTFFVSLSFLFCVYFYTKKHLKFLILSLIFCGLATSVLYNGALIIVPIVISVILLSKEEAKGLLSIIKNKNSI